MNGKSQLLSSDEDTITPAGGRIELLNSSEDSLLAILSFCGISGVVAVSQTCRYLQALAFSRYVWLSLVLDLQSRMILDVPPNQNLRDLSTSELVAMAKHLVLGPKFWTHPYSVENAISRKYSLRPFDTNPEILSARLLPGGRYVAITSQHFDDISEFSVIISQCGKLHLWNVPENAPVWQYDLPHRSYPQECRYDVDMLDDGRSAIILIVEPLLDSADSQSQSFFVDIIHLDLVDGSHFSLFNINLGDVHEINDQVSFLAIRGDVAVVKITRQLFFINWKTRSCVILGTDVPKAECIALTRDHFIRLTTSDSPKITVWDIEVFATLGSPANAPDKWHSGSIGDVPSFLSELLALSSGPYRSLSMTVHESPLCEGIYQVSVVSIAHDEITMLRYSLSTSRSPISTAPWRLKSSSTADTGQFFGAAPDATYAGHVWGWRFDMAVVNLRNWTGPEDGGALVTLTGAQDLDEFEEYNTITLSDYNGVVVLATNLSILLRYYC